MPIRAHATPTSTKWNLPVPGQKRLQGGASTGGVDTPRSNHSLPTLGHADLERFFSATVELGSNLIVFGPSGSGKTRHTKDWLRAQGIPYLYRNFSALERPDLLGLPEIKNGRSSYALPDFLPDASGPATVLILDEIDKCARELDLPLLELFDEHRSINGQPVNVRAIIATANLIDEEAGSRRMNHALVGRAALVCLEPNMDEWSRWASQNGIHASVLSFLRAKPDFLLRPADDPLSYATPTPRRWEQVSRALSTLNPGAALTDLIAAAHLGQTAATEFAVWIRYYRDVAIAIEQILNGEPAAGVEGADRLLIVGTSLCSRVVESVSSGSACASDHARRAFAWLGELPTDLLYGALYPYYGDLGEWISDESFRTCRRKLLRLMTEIDDDESEQWGDGIAASP